MRRAARPLMYLGTVVIVLGLSKYHAARVAVPPYDLTDSKRFFWALAYIAFVSVAAYGAGMPEVPRGSRSMLGLALAVAVAGALPVSIVQLIGGDALLPRFVVLGAALIEVPWFAFCAVLAQGGEARAADRDRVVIVAVEEAEVSALRKDLDSAPEHPATVVGHLQLSDVVDAEGASLVDAVRDAGATVVVLDRASQLESRVVAQAALLHERGIRIRTLSLFYEEWLGKIPLVELERVSLMFDIGEIHRARYGRVKRVIDVLLASGALLAMMIVVPFVLIGNLVANRGPLLFRQPRIGKNGEAFEIVKFRTMDPNDEAEGEWTAAHDPRITPLGRFLRTTHIDELPQSVNILRGDLAVVGPRPEQPHYVAELATKLPFYEVRHLVRPGLTGWAQVKYPYGGDEHDAMEKLQYEFFYLRHQRLSLDLRIMGRTVRSILGRQGR